MSGHATRDDMKRLMKNLNQKPIAFYPAYAKLAGSVGAGLMLSQAVFLKDTDATTSMGGWFFRTREKWEAETMMGRSEQETARRKLRELRHDGKPIWIEERRGIPAKMYFYVDMDVLLDALATVNLETIQPTEESGQLVGDDPSVQLAEIRPTSGQGIQPSIRRGKENNKENNKETTADGGERPNPGTAPDPLPDPVPEVMPDPADPPEPTRVPKEGAGRTDTGDTPERTYTPDQQAFGLAGVYYGAMGVDRRTVAKGTLMKVKNTLKPLVGVYDEEDVRGCVGYLRSDPWWREPGRLTPGKVVATLPEWVASGRPQARVPSGKANGRANGHVEASGAVTGDGWRELAAQLRQQEARS